MRIRKRFLLFVLSFKNTFLTYPCHFMYHFYLYLYYWYIFYLYLYYWYIFYLYLYYWYIFTCTFYATYHHEVAANLASKFFYYVGPFRTVNKNVLIVSLSKHFLPYVWITNTKWQNDCFVIFLVRKEGNVLFNDTLNTLYLWLYWCRTYGKGPLR